MYIDSLKKTVRKCKFLDGFDQIVGNLHFPTVFFQIVWNY